MKSDLLVFIRPQILRDAQAIEDVTEQKYNGIRQEEKSLNKGHIMLLPGQKQPSIPAVPPGAGRPSLPPPDANVEGAVPNSNYSPPPSIAMPPSTALPAPAAPPATPPPATAAPQPAPSQHP
jgi:general secretion pathway protein D